MATSSPGKPRSPRRSIRRALGGFSGIGLALGLAALLLPAGLSTGAGAGASSAASTGGLWIAVYNGLEVQAVVHGLAGELRAGDGIAVVMGNNSSTWSQDNAFATELHQAFPNVTLRAYLSLDGGTGKAGGLATTIAGLSPLFTQVSADWEPNG